MRRSNGSWGSRLGWLVIGGTMLSSLPGCGSNVAPGPQPTPTEFRVSKGDRLQIAVWPDNELDLAGEYAVEEDGFVYLPLVGGVEVEGLTLSEVRVLLRRSYAQSLKEPVVRVTPTFPVSVLGRVVRPGLYRVTPTETLFDAISMAGGFASGADQSEVQIIRNGVTIEVDAQATLSHGADLSLHSGDRVIVPARRWNFGMRDVLFALQSVALAITLANRIGN